MRVTSYKPTAF
ncbi:BgTH12-04951 [Blumeria graminis f. sp. triticale]|uniref:BgTH12-04951 n=1 Tax=Blumeria graminis f. sp. triticale TaxID=1689686 RepID=A0A9W4GF32_BLUGR|nr:BgTH12-04951 [Blumeria graminis f. sp. triticale]